jgi:hypothetical protein
VAVTAALALTAGGCSFLFSEGAPAGHERMENFTCGESRTPPIVDTVATGLLAAGVAVNASNIDETVAKEPLQNQDDRRREINVAIGVGSAFAVIGLASAIYGYRAVSDCRGARAARELALAQSRALALPPPYGVPPDGEPPPYWPPPPAAAPWPPPAVTPPPPAPPSP